MVIVRNSGKKSRFPRLITVMVVVSHCFSEVLGWGQLFKHHLLEHHTLLKKWRRVRACVRFMTDRAAVSTRCSFPSYSVAEQESAE